MLGKYLRKDQSIATGRELSDRKPDLHVGLVDKMEIWIFRAVCAWEPVVRDRKVESTRNLR